MLAGAWIVTPGTNTGIYEMIGAGVKEYVETHITDDNHPVVLLGIASWGSVFQRDKLKVCDILSLWMPIHLVWQKNHV